MILFLVYCNIIDLITILILHRDFSLEYVNCLNIHSSVVYEFSIAVDNLSSPPVRIIMTSEVS